MRKTDLFLPRAANVPSPGDDHALGVRSSDFIPTDQSVESFLQKLAGVAAGLVVGKLGVSRKVLKPGSEVALEKSAPGVHERV